MRTILAMTCVGALLAGCGARTADTDPLIHGVQAFRTGDQAALTLTVARLADEPATAPEPCSAAAFAAERRHTVGGVLGALDNNTLFSISEEARFLYLIGMGLDRQAPADASMRDCRQSANFPVQAQDFIERMRMMATYSDALRIWKQDLTARHGEELQQRLATAMRVLEVNHILPKRWSLSSARANVGTSVF